MKFSEEEKTLWLKKWRRSGKKAWTYAKENGISPQSFCNWVKRETKKVSGFVEIPDHKKPKPELLQEILIEKGEIKIHIPVSIWIESASAIMEGLKVRP